MTEKLFFYGMAVLAIAGFAVAQKPAPAGTRNEPVLPTQAAAQAAVASARGLDYYVYVAAESADEVYKVVFDSIREGDTVVPQEGFDVYLDSKSVIYLRGIVLDFQKGLSGRGFQFSNPNASNTCGCGESFAV